jgi:catechol 2,3-dioxygenase-like lactoylglutathione lyase family enzyme
MTTKSEAVIMASRCARTTFVIAVVVAAGFAAPARPGGEERKLFSSRTITHVGMVVHDAQKVSKAYADILGVTASPVTETKPPIFPRDYAGDRKAHTRVANVQFENIRLEIAEPVGGPSPWREFLETHGEGFHHLGFDVTDVGDQLKLLESKGGRRVIGASADYALVDTLQQYGIALELTGSAKPKMLPQPATHGLKTLARIGLLVFENPKYRDRYVDLWGMKPEGGIEGHGVKFPKDYAASPDAANREIYMPFDNIYVNLISPLEGTGKSTWRDMAEAHQGYINCIVDDVPSTVKYLEEKGAKRTLGDETTTYAYMNLQPQLAATALLLKYPWPPAPRSSVR